MPKDVIQEHEGFSYEYMKEVMEDGSYLMSGNKTDFKLPDRLAQFLFRYNDGLMRQHWDDKPYRVLYKRAMLGLGQV